MKARRISGAVVVAVMAVSPLVAVSPAEAHKTGIHDNCTKFNNKYPHGVGRRGANDKGGNVTNFKRSNKIYNKAEKHNSDLDRDNDKIACEQA